MSMLESNCDGIGRYEVWYSERDSNQWSKSLAAYNEDSETIAGLHFTTEYEVMLLVFNNKEKGSTSETHIVETSPGTSLL